MFNPLNATIALKKKLFIDLHSKFLLGIYMKATLAFNGLKRYTNVSRCI